MVARHFGSSAFSSVMGLIYAVIGLGTSAGVLVLTVSLAETDRYAIFLLFSAVAVLMGAFLYLFMDKRPPEAPEPAVLPSAA